MAVATLPPMKSKEASPPSTFMAVSGFFLCIRRVPSLLSLFSVAAGVDASVRLSFVSKG